MYRILVHAIFDHSYLPILSAFLLRIRSDRHTVDSSPQLECRRATKKQKHSSKLEQWGK